MYYPIVSWYFDTLKVRYWYTLVLRYFDIDNTWPNPSSNQNKYRHHCHGAILPGRCATSPLFGVRGTPVVTWTSRGRVSPDVDRAWFSGTPPEHASAATPPGHVAAYRPLRSTLSLLTAASAPPLPLAAGVQGVVLGVTSPARDLSVARPPPDLRGRPRRRFPHPAGWPSPAAPPSSHVNFSLWSPEDPGPGRVSSAPRDTRHRARRPRLVSPPPLAGRRAGSSAPIPSSTPPTHTPQHRSCWRCDQRGGAEKDGHCFHNVSQIGWNNVHPACQLTIDILHLHRHHHPHHAEQQIECFISQSATVDTKCSFSCSARYKYETTTAKKTR